MLAQLVAGHVLVVQILVLAVERVQEQYNLLNGLVAGICGRCVEAEHGPHRILKSDVGSIVHPGAGEGYVAQVRHLVLVAVVFQPGEAEQWKGRATVKNTVLPSTFLLLIRA